MHHFLGHEKPPVDDFATPLGVVDEALYPGA